MKVPQFDVKQLQLESLQLIQSSLGDKDKIIAAIVDSGLFKKAGMPMPEERENLITFFKENEARIFDEKGTAQSQFCKDQKITLDPRYKDGQLKGATDRELYIFHIIIARSLFIVQHKTTRDPQYEEYYSSNPSVFVQHEQMIEKLKPVLNKLFSLPAGKENILLESPTSYAASARVNGILTAQISKLSPKTSESGASSSTPATQPSSFAASLYRMFSSTPAPAVSKPPTTPITPSAKVTSPASGDDNEASSSESSSLPRSHGFRFIGEKNSEDDRAALNKFIQEQQEHGKKQQSADPLTKVHSSGH